MRIVLDINLLKQMRNQYEYEIAIIIDKYENLLLIHGDHSSVHSIPLDQGIIGHTHPFQYDIDLNPSSKIDIESCLLSPHRGWFIIDECGVWT